MNKEKRYRIYNRMEGVFTQPEAMTLDEAARFVQRFLHRYAKQGYYLTTHLQRVRPEDMRLDIIDEGVR